MIKYVLVMLLCSVIAFPIAAQNLETPEEGTAKVKIIKNINGEVTVIEKEVPISQKEDIDKMLEELNISQDLGDNEDIEIIIRQGDGHHGAHKMWKHAFEMADDKPFLGVYLGSTKTKTITNDDGDVEIEETVGDDVARVTGIVEGSAAEEAGLQKDDVITAIGDHAVSNYESLVEALGNFEAGDEVTVSFEREGAAQSVQATLGKKAKSKEHMHDFMKEFKMHGGQGFNFEMADPDKGFLGVHIRDLNEEDGIENGVFITDAIEETAAAEMGLQEGDVLTHVNGTPVNSIEELVKTMGEHKAGDNVEVTYLREGVSQTGSGELKPRGDMFQLKNNFNFKNSCTPEQIQECIEKSMKSLENIDWSELGDKMEGIDWSGIGRAFEDMDWENFDEEAFEERMEKFELHMEQFGEQFEDLEFDFHNLGDSEHRMIAIMIRVDDISKEDEEMLLKNNPGLDLNNNLDVDNMKFSPNPNDGNFELGFELADEAPVTVRIFDPNGRQVYTEALSDFTGTYNNQIDVSEGSDGVYFLVVEQNGKTYSRKVVVQ